MPVVLGIDAAWTPTRHSGIALVKENLDGWRLVRACSSVNEFLGEGDRASASPAPLDARSLLEAARRMAHEMPAVVAVDMPLVARGEITGRRFADNAVSSCFGAAKCSTHSPTPNRPGQVASQLRDSFADAGYVLATAGRPARPRTLIEAYPHPAVMRLLGERERVPYKIASKGRSERAVALGHQRRIADALRACFRDVDLEVPRDGAPLRELKAFEDTVDALVCAWVGVKYLSGGAFPYGDSTAAIWIPGEYPVRL